MVLQTYEKIVSGSNNSIDEINEIDWQFFAIGRDSAITQKLLNYQHNLHVNNTYE
jgi:hypothetical protein